jgi:hypothetical protein
VTVPVCPTQPSPGSKWIVAPFQKLSDWVSAESLTVARLEDALTLSKVDFFGRETSSEVLGHRASIIIRPSTNTWLRPVPRFQLWSAL